MRKKSSTISTIILIIFLLVGLSVMLYPTVSDWWNSKVQTRAVSSYVQTVAQKDDGEIERMLEEARDYNKRLARLSAPFAEFDELTDYNDILNLSGTGIMGYITIPVIRAEFPIYHGTSEEVLNIAAGHLEGSSLPVGGVGTHSVISAHRGLPSARLFTDLDKLVVGDTFTITILNDVYTYEVEEIFIVLPDQLDKIALVPEKDYVTLMTCTPYGVNTHRLLVRSHRTDTILEKEEIRVSPDAVKVDSMIIVPLIAAPLLLILFIIWFAGGKRKKNYNYEDLLY